MGFILLGIGLLIGIFVGVFAYYGISRKSEIDPVKIAEDIAAKIFACRTDQILHLAEAKLSDKKDAIDGTLKNMKDEIKRVEAIMKDIGNGNIKIDTRLENAATVIKDLTETAGRSE